MTAFSLNQRFQMRLTFGLLTLVSLGAMGCGLAVYEERLQASVEFHEYMQLVEANLASPIWERNDLGLKMRVPLPFRTPLPRPEALTDADGETYYGPDERHPAELGIYLPGIVEAWETQLPGERGEQVISRLFVLTNHERFVLVDGTFSDEPSEFHRDLEQTLAGVFRVFIPEGVDDLPGDNSRYRHLVPPRGSRQTKFVTPKDYNAIRFVSDREINGQPIQAMLYELNSGDIQAAVLLIGPEALSIQYRQRLDLALQTFVVEPRQAGQINTRTGTVEPTGGTGGF